LPFQRPTIQQIIQQNQAQILSYLPGTNPYLPGSDLQILAYVLGGLQYLRYGYLDWIAQQAIPVTATGESLSAWAALKGLELEAATPATGSVQFSGTPGATIPDLTILVRADGYLYAIPTGFGGTIGGGGTFSTTAVATTAGIASNFVTGSPYSTLQLQTSLSGVLNTVTVTSNFTGGADVETEDSLRTRLIELFSNPPQGGCLADYVTWALAATPAITRAWSAGPPVMGPGSVSVYFMEDEVEAAYSGVPQGDNGVSTYESRGPTATGDQLIIANALYNLRPATAIVYAMAPSAVAIPITLAEVPVNATIRSAISTAYSSFFIMNASPVGVLLPDLTAGGTVRLSELYDEISAVSGLDYFEITSWNSTTPADITLSETGQIAIPGIISFA
jgi:uncharacterized phage protein gp47/JayE